MKRVTVLLLILTIALYGCTTGGGGVSKIGKDYRKGTQALQLNFLPNAPPPELFDMDDFVVGLEVRNKGASTVGSGTIYLSGYDPATFPSGLTGEGITNNQISITNLEGLSMYNPEGGYAAYSLSGTIASLKVNSYTPTIMATACYVYTTQASTDICIDPDPYSTKIKEKACTTSNVALSGGQGAPIEVTGVQLDPTSKDIRITFQIKNSGGGLVFDKGKIVDCSPFSIAGIGLDAKNKISVDSVVLSIGTEIKATCQPKGDLKLFDGQATLMCQYTIPNTQAAYKTPLTITLSYGYRSSTARSVKIVKTPSSDSSPATARSTPTTQRIL